MDKLDSSIYLLQLRESYERKEDIFKIGRPYFFIAHFYKYLCRSK